MTKNVSSSTLRRSALVSTFAALSVIASTVAGPVLADISPRGSFLAIQKQVESIEPGMVKSTVVIKLFDGSGSGVIISPDGLVVTAGHVVEGRVGRRVTVVLADGRSLPATVLASNQDSDLGLVKINDITGLPTSPVGDSSTLRRGEWVLATGHPLGQHEGRPPVLRIGRVLRVGGGRFGRETRSVTTDAPIISGDSGGPLFDLSGRVVGINSMITTGDRRMTSIHIPINLAKAAVARSLHGDEPDSWDGPPAAFLSDLREGQAALQSGDTAAAARLGREAMDLDQNSAAARLLIAHANARSGQAQLALSAISQACDRGYNDADALRKDPDFAPLANQPAMARILERLDAFNGVPGERKTDISLFAQGAPANLGRGVACIQSAGSDVSLGTVMTADGDILTKASELPEGPLTCVLSDGQSVPVMRQGVDADWDVALLKANVAGLKVLPMADANSVGEWTFSPDSSGGLAAIGIVGVLDMPVHGRGIATKPTSKAYLGVQMQPLGADALKAAGVPHGILVMVQRDLPADRAGVQSGDILVEAEGKPIYDPDAFMDMMVKKKPGDVLNLQVARGSERVKISVPLASRPVGLPGRNGLPEMLSGEISRMQGPFTHVIHHDAVLKPNAMGGPLLDAEGRCIGLNIARADRTSTYAISTHDIRDILTKLKAAK